jgi:hypothetical protein
MGFTSIFKNIPKCSNCFNRFKATCQFSGESSHALETLKTGRRWATSPKLSFIQAIILKRDTVQFGVQSTVAARCKLNYRIWFKEEIGYTGYRQHLSLFAGYMSWQP